MKILHSFLALLPLLLTDGKENVIFEQIGTMTGATSYIHVHIDLSLSTLEHLAQYYNDYLDNHFSSEEKIVDFMMAIDNSEISHKLISKFGAYTWLRIAELHRVDCRELLEISQSLRGALPVKDHATRTKISQYTTPTPYTDQHQRTLKHIKIQLPTPLNINDTERYRVHVKLRDNKAASFLPTPLRENGLNKIIFPETFPFDHEIRHRYKRVAGLIALPIAIAATAVGAVNSVQIRQLQQDLDEVAGNQKRILSVINDFTENFQSITDGFNDIRDTMAYLIAYNPAILTTLLGRMENKVRMQVIKATHALQTGLHRRLAVDYLNPQQVLQLFQQIKTRADDLNCQLLIEHHSDLFQIETSLLFDGQDGHLVIHVPLSPKNAVLRLFRLHPFPVPFLDDHYLIPDTKQDILAISSTDTRLNIQLTTTDLMTCDRLGKIYLCDKFGVMSRNFSHTCLGALYMQDFSAAKTLCNFLVSPLAEKVYQLRPNRFIAYLPTPITVQIACRNGTHSELHLARGTQQISLSPGCKAEFSNHIAISDYSTYLDSEILHFEMDWAPMNLTPGTQVELSRTLGMLKQLNLHLPSLGDLQQAHSHHQSKDLIHFGGFGLAIAILVCLLGVFALAVCWCCSRRRNQPGGVNIELKTTTRGSNPGASSASTEVETLLHRVQTLENKNVPRELRNKRN